MLSYDNSYLQTTWVGSLSYFEYLSFCREDAEKMAALASADKTLLQSSQKQKSVSNNASAKSGK